jgi:tRNA 2-thiocytidine biosynthesis protein TtcA
MLAEWQKEHPGRVENIFSAICNVSPSQLADRNLFDFENLEIQRPEKTPEKIEAVQLWQ